MKFDSNKSSRVKLITLYDKNYKKTHKDISNKMSIIPSERYSISSLVGKIGKLYYYFTEKLNSIIFFVKHYAKNLNKFLACFFHKKYITFKWYNMK